MKKALITLISFSILLQSCYTTKPFVIERTLQKQLIGLAVEDVISQLGSPDEVDKTENRYVYIYYYEQTNRQTEYTKVTFGNDNFARSVQSTKTEVQRRFSVGKTIWMSILGIVAITILSAASSGE